jgi:outer membrane lipoprotein-sorting protein
LRTFLLVTGAILFLFSSSLFAQETGTGSIENIVTVNDVKAVMAEAFENIEDYVADIEWVNGAARYRGVISYKKANKILIEFEEPEGQIISSNGDYLYIYIPYLKVVVQQTLGEETQSELFTTTSQAGLTKLFNEYAFSFFDTSSLQPFGNTMAYHLKLDQKRPKVGFKKMDLWVSRNGLILQSNGTSPNGLNVSLSFSNIRVNTELPDYIFDFEVPADAQIIRNVIIPFADTAEEDSSE